MKLMTGILVLAMTAATAWGQNPNVIQSTRATMKGVQAKKAADSNAALEAGGHHSRPASAHSSVAERPVSHHAQVFARPTSAARHTRRVEHVSVADNKQAAPAAKSDRHEPINLTNRRDPFLSPVVLQTDMGSGCSTGKKCLSIGQIALKGIVKSDSGMIAVVVNSLDKAYFLHENDPVFNGYVLRITGDSVVFKETVQDRLGKPITREVTKKIVTPAV
jgi:Tfp pilus assembly protein PilP